LSLTVSVDFHQMKYVYFSIHSLVTENSAKKKTKQKTKRNKLHQGKNVYIWCFKEISIIDACVIIDRINKTCVWILLYWNKHIAETSLINIKHMLHTV
jgi:hypothetical protein